MASLRKREMNGKFKSVEWDSQIPLVPSPSESMPLNGRDTQSEEADRRGLPADSRSLERLTVADPFKRYSETVLPHKRAAQTKRL